MTSNRTSGLSTPSDPSGRPASEPVNRKVLVMTGGTSGFGRRMLERLLNEKPSWQVYVIARSPERAAELQALPAARGRLTVVSADLASMQSVASAADSILTRLAGTPIDAISFNAGLQAIQGDQASKDGLELSFAVNHLAHYYLAERLMPAIRDGGRLVITSSVVHDPQAFCLVGITRAAWEDPAVMADAAQAQNQFTERVDRGEARYCASKLLNLMHARHLAQIEPRIATIAFNPAIVPGTEIARERNFLQILGWKYIMPLMAPFLPGVRTMSRSADDLLWLVTEAEAKALSGKYLDGRTVMPGSDESRDPAKIARVIDVSRNLVRKLALPDPVKP